MLQIFNNASCTSFKRKMLQLHHNACALCNTPALPAHKVYHPWERGDLQLTALCRMLGCADCGPLGWHTEPHGHVRPTQAGQRKHSHPPTVGHTQTHTQTSLAGRTTQPEQSQAPGRGRVWLGWGTAGGGVVE